ncbi:MAG: hypothetical protein ACOYEO_04120 [bacterium]|jgi:hypothetical protein
MGRISYGLVIVIATVVAALLLGSVALAAQEGNTATLGQRSLVRVPVGSNRSNIVVMGRSVKVEGEVTNSVLVISGDVYVAGYIGKSVVVVGGTVVLMPTAVVEKDVVVVGGNLQEAEGARVAGKKIVAGLPDIRWPRLNRRTPFGHEQDLLAPWWTFRLDTRAFQFLRLITNLILGGLVLILLPSQIGHMTGVLGSNWIRFMLLGAVSYPITVIVTILVGLTIIGLPLALLLALALAVAMLLGKVTVAVFIGHRLWRLLACEVSLTVALFTGLTILFVISQIPAIRVIEGTLVALIGLGAVVDTRFGSGKPWLPPRAS